MTDTDKLLAEIRALCDAATPITADMIHRYEHGGARVMRFQPTRELIADLYSKADRECWIACRMEMPKLLALVETLTRERDEARASEGRLREAGRMFDRAYVRLMESGRDRISDLGGQCDPLDVMERSDPWLKAFRAALAAKEAGA